MTQPCPHDLSERENACADGYCPLCLASVFVDAKIKFAIAMKDMEKELDRRQEALDNAYKVFTTRLVVKAVQSWNNAIEAAAQRANAAFLIDPLTSPAEAIRGLRKP